MLPVPEQVAADPRFAPALALVEDVLLTTEEVAKHLRVSQENLRMMRAKGQGPAFFKLNARAVRYSMAAVLRFQLEAEGKL